MECINHKSIYSDNLNTINQQRHENLKSIESVFNRIEERQKANLLDYFLYISLHINEDEIRQKILNDLSSVLNHDALIRLMSMRDSKQ